MLSCQAVLGPIPTPDESIPQSFGWATHRAFIQIETHLSSALFVEAGLQEPLSLLLRIQRRRPCFGTASDSQLLTGPAPISWTGE